MSSLQLSFLGPVQLRREDKIITLKRAKSVALLAYLAITATPQTRDHIVTLLWPDSPPDAARKNLRNVLWAIGQALGSEVIQAGADHLTLSAAVWCDVHIFQSLLRQGISPTTADLQMAVDLYRGALLDDLIIADAPDFELWLISAREHFGQSYLRGLAALVAIQRASSHWVDVISLARRALAYDNLQEPMYRTLMEAHTYLGERGEALRQYERLRTVLAQELGVKPLPETEKLREAILSGQLQPKPTPTSAASSPQPVIKPSGAPFVGREAEYTALSQALQLAHTGAKVLLLTGELGIGKSRLWQEWVAALGPSRIVLETRCLDTTQALPFVPLIRLFSHPVCMDILFKSPTLHLSPMWLAELTRLLPEIRRYRPEIPEPAQLPPEEERWRLFEAFTQLLRLPKSRPHVLFIDDLHWADSSTLDWLIYLVDRLQHESLLLVGAYRPSEASAQLVRVVANWLREGVAQRLSLPPLTVAEAAQVVAGLERNPALVENLHQKSGGNPYFLVELTRAWPNDAPPSLTNLIRERLNRLPEVARQVLQSAAILEPDFDFAILRRTAGRDEEETLKALDMLLTELVLIEREAGYEFSHPLVAAIVREDLSLARRGFLHRRAAEALEASHAGHLESIAGQLTSHYLQAGRATQAAYYAQLAAEQALKLGAPAEAERFYRQALQLEPTPEREMGLGRTLYNLGDLAGARQAYHEAVLDFEESNNLLGLAKAYLALADSYRLSQQGDEITHWAEQALRLAGSDSDPAIAAKAHHLLGTGMLLLGRALDKAEDHLSQAVQLASVNNLSSIAAQAQFGRGNLLARRGSLKEALQAFAQTIVLAHNGEDYFQEALGHNNLAYHALLAHDLVTAHQHIALGLTLAEKQSLFLPSQYLYSTRGEIALAEGRLDEAEQWFKRGLAEAERYGNQVQVVSIRANLGLVVGARRKLDEANLK